MTTEMDGQQQAREWLNDEGFVLPTQRPTNWVGSVLPAAVWAIDPGNPRADQQAALAYGMEPSRSVIVLMIDGLGLVPLTSYGSYARNMRRLPTEPVVAQTTVPSTTAAALTAFTTSQLPGATRMVGYTVGRGDHTMTLLNFEPGTSPENWQQVPPLFEHEDAAGGLRTGIITKPKFRDSGLTRASFRGGKFVGLEKLEQRLAAALDAVRNGMQLQVVYWSDIDHTGHGYGVGSPKWTLRLEELDGALARFLPRVPSDVSVVLTADHGMVNVEHIIDIAHVPALREGVRFIAGEGRAVHLHTVDQDEGAQRRVLQRWAEHLGEQAVVVPTDQMEALIGPGPGLQEIGAGMVFLRGRTVILDSRTQNESVFEMKGVHGSLTFDEMAIPVWRLA